MFLTAFWVVFASLCPAADPGKGPGGPGAREAWGAREIFACFYFAKNEG